MSAPQCETTAERRMGRGWGEKQGLSNKRLRRRRAGAHVSEGERGDLAELLDRSSGALESALRVGIAGERAKRRREAEKRRERTKLWLRSFFSFSLSLLFCLVFSFSSSLRLTRKYGGKNICSMRVCSSRLYDASIRSGPASFTFSFSPLPLLSLCPPPPPSFSRSGTTHGRVQRRVALELWRRLGRGGRRLVGRRRLHRHRALQPRRNETVGHCSRRKGRGTMGRDDGQAQDEEKARGEGRLTSAGKGQLSRRGGIFTSAQTCVSKQ